MILLYKTHDGKKAALMLNSHFISYADKDAQYESMDALKTLADNIATALMEPLHTVNLPEIKMSETSGQSWMFSQIHNTLSETDPAIRMRGLRTYFGTDPSVLQGAEALHSIVIK